LGEVAEHGHRVVLGSPPKHPQCHRTVILRLVDHHMAIGRQDPNGNVRRFIEQRKIRS